MCGCLNVILCIYIYVSNCSKCPKIRQCCRSGTRSSIFGHWSRRMTAVSVTSRGRLYVRYIIAFRFSVAVIVTNNKYILILRHCVNVTRTDDVVDGRQQQEPKK